MSRALLYAIFKKLLEKLKSDKTKKDFDRIYLTDLSSACNLYLYILKKLHECLESALRTNVIVGFFFSLKNRQPS